MQATVGAADTAFAGAPARELVVIDARVAGADLLRADLDARRAGGVAIDVLDVAGDEDGIASIRRALSDGTRYGAVHVFAHGEPGELLVGATAIDLRSLRARAGDFSAWSAGLTDSADLLFYGCDVAATPRGSDFIAALAALTGTDVAASTDRSGHALLGGDWQLEATTGSIESASVVTGDLAERWLTDLSTATAGNERLVNTTRSGDQSVPADEPAHQIASNGTLSVVVWVQASDQSIRFRFADASGPIGSELVAYTPASGAIGRPAVAIDDQGNVTIVWQDTQTSGDADATGISLLRFDVHGNAISTLGSTGPIRVNQTTAGAQDEPAIAQRPDGGFVVTWTSTDPTSGDAQILGRAFAAGGASAGAEFAINAIGAGDQHRSAVAVGGTAGDMQTVVTWQSEGTDGNGSGIYARRFAADGTAIDASEWRVNVGTAGNQVTPTIAADANRNFAIAWASEDGPSDFTVKVRSFLASGAAVANSQNANGTADIALSDLSGPSDIAPAIAMDRQTGSFVVAFEGNSGSTSDIYRQQFNATGVSQEANLIVNATQAGVQRTPSAAIVNGTVRIVWNGNGQDALSGASDANGVFLRDFAIAQPGVQMSLVTSSALAEGQTARIAVRLNSNPGNSTPVDVTVNLTTSLGGVSGTWGPLRFDSTNWNQPQYIDVGLAADTVHTGTFTLSLYATPTSANTGYNQVNGAHLSLDQLDDDGYTVLTVTTTADENDGGTSSPWQLVHAPGGTGLSLREALLALNRPGNLSGSQPDEIRFDLPGATAGNTIALASALPAVARPIRIDGTTQPGYAGTPVIALTTSSASAFNGLSLGAGSDGSTVVGLAIEGFGGVGIDVQSSRTTIADNRIGTDVAGLTAVPNLGGGIAIRATAAQTRVIGNVVASPAGSAILVDGASATLIRGNRVGVRADASAAFDGVDGIVVQAAATQTQILDNWIGGAAGAGIRIRGTGTDQTAIQGNGIGTSPDGTNAFANRDGIRVESGAGRTTIGGTIALAVAGNGPGNVIGGNSGHGIVIDGAATTLTVVEGNQIGTNAAGLRLGNGGNGVLVSGGAHDNLIGGLSPAAGNRIFYNNAGGSPSLAGVQILDAGDVTIGNAIVGNVFVGNGHAIDLRNADGSSEPDTIDAGDVDTGANDLLNRPKILDIQANDAGTSFQYELVAQPGSYRIEFYRDPTPVSADTADAPTLIGFQDIQVDGSGTGTFVASLAWTGLSIGDAVRATATLMKAPDAVPIETSEFSDARLYNHAPAFDGATLFTPDENIGTAFATLSARDIDAGQQVSITLDPTLDSARFVFDPTSRTLRFAAPPDFEAPADTAVTPGDNVYELDFRAVDSLGAATVQRFQVAVQPVNEPPVIAGGPARAVTVDETATFVAAIDAADPDGPRRSFSISGGADRDLFRISGGGVLTFAAPPDYESVLSRTGDHRFEVEVTVDDGAGLSASQRLSVTVAPVDEPPLLTRLSYAAPENGRSVALEAWDPEQGTAGLQYRIVGGADVGAFTIDAGSGVLRFIDAPDYERPASAAGTDRYDLLIQVFDSAGHSRVEAIAIDVTDVEEAPVVVAPATLSATEDIRLALGGAIGVSDPDASGHAVDVVIALSDATAGTSAVAATGTLTLGSTAGLSLTEGDGDADARMHFTGSLAAVQAALANARFDPAANFDGTVRLTLTAADALDGSLSTTRTVTIAVAPVNDAPSLAALTPVTLTTATSVPIAPAQLAASDVDDSAAQLRYQILAAPTLGSLTLDGVPLRAGQSFTQAQLDAGQIAYRHTDALAGEDVAVLRLTDRAGARSTDITLQLKSVAPVAAAPTGSSTGSSSSAGATSAGGTTAEAGNGSASTTQDAVAGAGLGGASVAPVRAPPPAPAGTPGTARQGPAATPAHGALAGDGGAGTAGSGTAAGHRGGNTGGADTRESLLATLGVSGYDTSSRVRSLAGEHLMLPRDASAGSPGRPSHDATQGQGAPREVLRQVAFRDDLAAMREQVNERVLVDRNVVASSAVMSGGLTIGYVIWLLRGGVLLSSLLAAVPAWSSFDPLPVLSHGPSGSHDDDDSLQEMLRKAKHRDAGEAASSFGPRHERPLDGVHSAS